MDHPISSGGLSGRRILVAPLDWGLGHTTRCIPLVRELLRQGATVWLAGNSSQQALLSLEFPQVSFLQLPGYEVKYGAGKRSLLLHMLWQLPKIRRRIRQEHQWLKKQVDKYQPDAVIADNRFGLWHSSVPCIFITHQLTIINPAGAWGHYFLQKINYRYIRRFRQCWVPDLPGADNLAGKLSHPARLPDISLRYIQPLTRLVDRGIQSLPHHLLISLSGPEPQRTILEEKILQQIKNYKGSIVMVRGLPAAAESLEDMKCIRFYNHLSAEAFTAEMQRASFIICRSGYSTIMDIAKLQQKAIVIPTPGQPEQEYLGKYLQEKGHVVCVDQTAFQFEDALQKAYDFSWNAFPRWDDGLLQTAVESLQTLFKK